MNDPPPSPHPLSYAQPAERQPRAGIISFACAIIAILSWCSSLIAVRQPQPSNFDRISMLVALVGVPLLGMTTGILALLPHPRKRGLAIVGLTINSVLIVLTLLIYFVVRQHWLANHPSSAK